MLGSRVWNQGLRVKGSVLSDLLSFSQFNLLL